MIQLHSTNYLHAVITTESFPSLLGTLKEKMLSHALEGFTCLQHSTFHMEGHRTCWYTASTVTLPFHVSYLYRMSKCQVLRELVWTLYTYVTMSRVTMGSLPGQRPRSDLQLREVPSQYCRGHYGPYNTGTTMGCPALWYHMGCALDVEQVLVLCWPM